MRIENVSSYLKEHGIKPSLQRMKIFQYLLDHHNHPTVDEIYKNLIDEIPTLSKTTVYNTLNIFVESNIANVVIIEEKEARYDAKIDTHGHFKCKICGAIEDFDVDISGLNLQKLGDASIEETHFFLFVVCIKCLENKMN